MGMINEWARRSYECAIRRGKTYANIPHTELVQGIQVELNELKTASMERESEHIEGMNEETEELVDVMLCCMTELYNRGENVEECLLAKLVYNQSRN